MARCSTDRVYVECEWGLNPFSYLVCFSMLFSLNMFGKELFIRFAVRVFRERLSVCLCASFPFGFEGGMWDLSLLIRGHCLFICF